VAIEVFGSFLFPFFGAPFSGRMGVWSMVSVRFRGPCICSPKEATDFIVGGQFHPSALARQTGILGTVVDCL